MPSKLILTVATAVVSGVGWSNAALAAGRSEPWQMNFQEAFSPVMERIHEFNTLLLIIQFAIVALVLGLLGYVIYRFNAKRKCSSGCEPVLECIVM